MSNATMFRSASPLRFGRALSLLALALAVSSLSACQVDDELDANAELDASAEPDQATPRDGTLACVSYCEARANQLEERCQQEGNDAVTCEQIISTHLDACVQRQCGLNIVLPQPHELEEIARKIGNTVLGPEFDLVDVTEHHWDPNTIGSRVYTFASGIDGAPGFVEMGATIDQPPVVSYGFGPTAEVATHEHAIERLTEFYGPLDYELGRRFFTAAHPVLEYTTAQGSYYYSVAGGDVSDSFDISDDPDADQELLSHRREGFKRQWDRYLSDEFE